MQIVDIPTTSKGADDQDDNNSNPPNKQPDKKLIQSETFFGKCKVCRDKATGIHYGIPTCEACKGFFKRSIEKNERYVCYFGYNCDITPNKRKRCKYCRWKACVEAGMSFDGIKMGRIPRIEKEKLQNLNDILDKRPNFQFLYQSDFFSDIINNTSLNLENINILNRNVDVDNSSQLVSTSYFTEYVSNTSNKNCIIIFSLFKDKCYQLYMKYNSVFKQQYDIINEKLSKGDNLNLANPRDLSPNVFWEINLKNIEEYLKSSINYIKQLPGFERLEPSVFKKAVIDRIFLIIGLRTFRLYINKEFYLMFSENINVSKELLNMHYGEEFVNRGFEILDKFNSLNLTDQELALFIPYVLTTTDQFTGSCPELKELNEYYSRVLYYEMSLNNRSRSFLIQLKEIMAIIFVIYILFPIY